MFVLNELNGIRFENLIGYLLPKSGLAMGVLGVCEEEAGVLVAAVDEELDDDGWVLEPINWSTDQVLPPLLLALDSAVR